MGRRRGGKKPKRKFEPPSIKKARHTEPALSTEQETPIWSFAIYDSGLTFDGVPANETFRHIAGHLRTYEGLTWAQITQRDHKVSKDQFVRQAYDRLLEIQQDDVDELWRLQFGARLRLWGIRDRRVFRVLWWDPGHRVCPSPKKHT